MVDEEGSEKLVVELDGELYRFNKFNLTFGEVLKAKKKARMSRSKNDRGEIYKWHEVFWIVNELFRKNGMEVDIDWLKDVPMSDLQHVVRKMAEKNGIGMD